MVEKQVALLIQEAVRGRDNAYAPYSRHPVGAALRTSTGKIYVGCNVENASFPLGNCAEQAAIAAMILDGESSIAEIVVVGPKGALCTPCGGCRQRIREFSEAGTVFYACSEQDILLRMTIAELLPESFGPENVK